VLVFSPGTWSHRSYRSLFHDSEPSGITVSSFTFQFRAPLPAHAFHSCKIHSGCLSPLLLSNCFVLPRLRYHLLTSFPGKTLQPSFELLSFSLQIRLSARGSVFLLIFLRWFTPLPAFWLSSPFSYSESGSVRRA
jgi:hypothetical protein